MRNIIFALFLMAAFCAAPLYPIVPAQAQNVVTMHNEATTTGASTTVCNSFQYRMLSVEFVVTGTASVNIQCLIGNGGNWVTLTGTGLPVEASSIVSISTYACSWVRTNIATCTDCTVTTYCMKW
jgi:hypothetical protein